MKHARRWVLAMIVAVSSAVACSSGDAGNPPFGGDDAGAADDAPSVARDGAGGGGPAFAEAGDDATSGDDAPSSDASSGDDGAGGRDAASSDSGAGGDSAGDAGSGDSASDASSDAPVDALPSDAGRDASADASADSGADAGGTAISFLGNTRAYAEGSDIHLAKTTDPTPPLVKSTDDVSVVTEVFPRSATQSIHIVYSTDPTFATSTDVAMVPDTHPANPNNNQFYYVIPATSSAKQVYFYIHAVSTAGESHYDPGNSVNFTYRTAAAITFLGNTRGYAAGNDIHLAKTTDSSVPTVKATDSVSVVTETYPRGAASRVRVVYSTDPAFTTSTDAVMNADPNPANPNNDQWYYVIPADGTAKQIYLVIIATGMSGDVHYDPSSSVDFTYKWQ